MSDRRGLCLGVCILWIVNGCSAASSKDSDPLNQDGGGADGFDFESGGFDTQSDTPLDPEKDNDGDGWYYKEDCNDRDPLVNPGAFDVPGDGVDNDCDGTPDNPVGACDNGSLSLTSTNAMDYAKALGLCQTTTEGASGKDKKWGVIKAQIVHADGSPGVDPVQTGILPSFGTVIKPRQGKSMIALSSGTARAPGQPGFIVPLSPSWTGSSEVTPPAGWPKNTAGCPEPFTKGANDSAALKLTIRVPTNAKTIHFDINFFSSEYITFVCSPYNDSFVALLDTKAPIDPKYSKNVSFDSKGNPINVNSGFFEVCTPGSAGSKTFPCAKGTTELQGTGFWDPARPRENGATSWLETKAPVVPGEVITLQFMIWDTGDHILDSTVLVDNFRWDATGTTNPVTDRPK